jgi:hypothetical protein
MKEIIVFSEDSPKNAPTQASASLRACADAARLAGLRVFNIPSEDFAEFGGADAVLDYLSVSEEGALGVLVGYIATPERYNELRRAALSKGVLMPQTVPQMRRVMEFQCFYPYIQDLTAKSVVVTSDEDVSYAVEKIGFPCFVKGGIKSRKEQGWDACTATNIAELEERWSLFRTKAYSAQNKMIVREVLSLRHVRKTENGFPMGREYRCFFTCEHLLGYGYYWTGDDPLAQLSPSEEEAMLAVARTAARRLNVPLLVVDVGQLEDGRWVVIETGDPQFCGVTQINAFQFWNALREHWSDNESDAGK